MTADIIDIKSERSKRTLASYNAKQASHMDEIVKLNIAAWATFWRVMWTPVVGVKK
jgi:hypothetical protein